MSKFLSRKLLMAIGAGVVAVVGSLWPEQEDLTEQIVMLAIGYMVAQGVVDATTGYKDIKQEVDK